MALVIGSQPTSIMAAYNPIPFVIYANQPTGADPCPVVFADVYFDGDYYGTISSTIYHAIVGPYAEYHFDIQDKAQEYLRTQLLVEPATTNEGVLTKHFTSCIVKFRETDIDTSGFTVSVGTEPVQGTVFTDPVGGGGEASDAFIILNSSLKHSDNIDLLTHLKKFTPAFASSTDFGWNLSHRPNSVPTFNYSINGGKYWVCYNDHDIMSWYTEENIGDGTFYVAVVINYIDGTSDNDTLLLNSLPSGGFGTNTKRSYWLNAGIPNLSSVFTSLTWSNIEFYTVFIYSPFLDITTQSFYVKNAGCCTNRIRIFFQNLLGGWDAVNMRLVDESSKTDSIYYQKSKPYISPDKRDRGGARMQPIQKEVVECYTEDYPESDMQWLKESLGSAQAFIQVPKDDLQSETSEFHPIVILDSENTIKKTDDTFVYPFTLKFTYANDVTNLRS